MLHYSDYLPKKDMKLVINKLRDVKTLNDYFKKDLYLEKDHNGREIFIYNLKKTTVVGNSYYYPNTILHSMGHFYDPIEENIMSLPAIDKNLSFEINKPNHIVINPVFFFIYNVDNYYHFIYDTLPYLYTYFHLKKTIPELKLLMNYPNSYSNEFYKFIIEFLELLGIYHNDILIVQPYTEYINMYVSSSYTHGIDSNLPPRIEIYNIYNLISKNALSKSTQKNHPKNIYISRRTHLNTDHSNIGTNYTSRRKMINEDDVVNYLNSKKFSEVFTENYSTVDKILMFNNAEHIVGSIGGGISNVIFSKPLCKLTAIVSPTFLDINNRFKYCLDKVNVMYFNETYHESDDHWKKYMRVRVIPTNIIGEIIDISSKTITISYVDEFVAGWNSSMKYKSMICNKIDCERLDYGLNSPFIVNMKKLKLII